MIALKPPRGLSHLPRRALLLASAALLCVFLLPAVAAQADSASSLTVVGTSDVSDSGLIQNVIQPDFHAAYPGYTFKYVGTATGTAITDAETGVNTPSVLIVHAASLENQFVGGGFSYLPFGLAIFRNDFVLAGPTASPDPAGVSANAANNIVQAFADTAAAGYNGGGTPKATFVARDSTSGTSVAEHAIWALVASSGLAPAGLTLCTVSAALGGGETPVIASAVTNSGDPCPGGGNVGLPPAADFPSWYVGTTTGQGPTIVTANACTGFASPTGTCYVFTDRGTYDYLASGLDPLGSDSNLTILTRNNSAAAPGGAYQLINYFHAYVINPSACTACGVNLTAAEDFVSLLTSPTVQAQLSTYLDGSPADNDTGGPPFVADASPTITLSSGFPSVDNAGTPVTVTGSVTNAEIGYPALTNQTVNVDEIEGGVPVTVASGTTTSSGTFSIPFTPTSSGSYEVSTGQITQVEAPTLSPVYADTLSPSSTSASSMSVQAGVSISAATGSSGGVSVSGALAPVAPDANALVTLRARPQGSSAAFAVVGGASLAAGQSAYAVSGTLAPGSYQVEVSYADPGLLLGATSSVASVTVPAPAPGATAHSVSFKKVTVKNGKLTVTGTLKPAPTKSGAKVELLVLRAGSVSKTKAKAKKKAIRARAAAILTQAAHTSVGIGKTSFTIKKTLKRGSLYVLELEYVQTGQSSSFSKGTSIAVH